MKFDVKNRFSGEVQFTAEIEADDDAPARIKMGLAVKWARQTGADLRGAYLAGADLGGADLVDAGQDARGYRFVGFLRDNKLRIVAGCRDFSLQEARARWKGRHADDPALKAECLAKVDLIAKVAKARGWKT